MTTYKPEFAKGATNVYRTENYIVKQVFGISLDSSLGNVTMSYDTYYLRTPDLDAIYEYMFSDRRNRTQRTSGRNLCGTSKDKSGHSPQDIA